MRSVFPDIPNMLLHFLVAICYSYAITQCATQYVQSFAVLCYSGTRFFIPGLAREGLSHWGKCFMKFWWLRNCSLWSKNSWHLLILVSPVVSPPRLNYIQYENEMDSTVYITIYTYFGSRVLYKSFTAKGPSTEPRSIIALRHIGLA